MSTRKISDLPIPTPICQHPQHMPSSMQVFSPGVYEHECPGCHAKITFSVGTHSRLDRSHPDYARILRQVHHLKD